MNATGVDDVRKLVHKLLLRAILKIAVLNDTPGSVEALVGPNSHRDIQKNDGTLSSFLSCSLLRSSTMRSPLRCLVTPWDSAPRIFTSSLFILKGDFAATFRSS